MVNPVRPIGRAGIFMILKPEELQKLCNGKSLVMQEFYTEQNMKPLKPYGSLHYYYKSEGKGRKQNACIIILVHAEQWPERNLKPLGIKSSFPFIKRTMDREELIDHHFDLRMTSLVYDNWDSLIEDERKIAGDEFANKLLPFKAKWPNLCKAELNRPGIQSSLNFSGEKTMNEIIQD